MGMIFIYNMPETPRFLIATHKYEKARACYNIMAKWNGKGENTADNFVFPEEAKRHLHH